MGARAMTTRRYLHIVRDEKFIDDGASMFEAVAAGMHDYALLGVTAPLRHVTRTRATNWTIREILDSGVASRVCDYTAVFVHYLSNHARALVDAAPPEARLVWIGWGADYYHLIASTADLLLPRTTEIFDQVTGRGTLSALWKARDVHQLAAEWSELRGEPVARVRLSWKLRDIRRGGNHETDLLNKFELFAPVLHDDYERVARALVPFTPKYVSWNYPIVLEALDGRLQQTSGMPKCILVGNSATFENNHVDAFEMINSVAADCRVVSPLSYGRKDYAAAVAQRGRELFGERFRALKTFMKYDEYVHMMSECSAAVMNHKRQQAVGNVVLMLFHGKRVYLRAENPVYRFFRREGALVFEMSELPEYLAGDWSGLNPDDVRRNREIVVRLFGPDAIREKTRNLLRTVSGG